MPEMEQEIKTFRIHYLCDECGKGEMRLTGLRQMADPPQYPHKCRECGAEKTFPQSYPLVITRQIA